VSEEPDRIADRRFAEALEETGTRDPRDYFRDRLRALREDDRAAYDEAIRFYRERVVEAISGGEDPIRAWRSYGLHLAERTAPGRTVQIDPEGGGTPYEADAPWDALIIHLPDAVRAPATILGMPAQLSPAQRATCDILAPRQTA